MRQDKAGTLEEQPTLQRLDSTEVYPLLLQACHGPDDSPGQVSSVQTLSEPGHLDSVAPSIAT